MEILAALSDDQTALVGCFLALVVCGLILTIGYYLGQVVRRDHAPKSDFAPTIDLSHHYRTQQETNVRKAA